MTDSTIIVKAHCNRCLGETRHFVVAARKQTYEDQGSYWETTVFEMLECCGCENITLRSTYESAADRGSTVAYFPPAVTRPTPAWLADYSFQWNHRNLSSMLQELYAALHAGSNRLAMMGARAIIDMAMLDKIGDQGTFADKLKKMETEGHISGTNRDYLQKAIEVGNAAAHRGHCPDNNVVNRVMDIVENLVQAVFVLPSAAATLQRSTPTRPTKRPAPEALAAPTSTPSLPP